MRAVIYPRISKEDQSAYSLSAQIEECKKYIEKEGYEFVDVYMDDGYSAKNMKRPGLERMLTDLKNKHFDMIVIWRLDRLTRNTLDGLNMVINMFRPAGVEFASVTEDIDTSTPDGMMMFTIRLSMAQNEREKIAERVTLGQESRAKDGKRNTSARPYGYNVGDDLKLIVNEEEAKVVRQIFDWYISGSGRSKIARTLNEMNILAARGGKWGEKIIGDILKNITYTGAVHWKMKGAPESERIIVHGVHEAIIPLEKFQLARNIFSRRRENDMNLSSYDFVFSTVVKCAVCGRSFHGKMKTFSDPKKPHYRYYRCSGKYRPDSMCDVSDLVETKLSDLVFKRFDLIIANDFDPKKEISKNDVNVEKERKRLEKQIQATKDRRKNWARAMGDGTMSYEEYTELVNEEKEKVDRWQKEIDALPKQESKVGKTRKEIQDELVGLKRNWSEMSNEARKLAIQTLFKRIVIGKVNGEWKVLGHEFA